MVDTLIWDARARPHTFVSLVKIRLIASTWLVHGHGQMNIWIELQLKSFSCMDRLDCLVMIVSVRPIS